MRKENLYRMDRAEAVAMLAAAPTVHLAGVTESGDPILRVLHGVVVDGGLAFHGAPAGEKMEAIGRPVVISVEEVVAEIPSYFLDAERACPATTYYRSVQLHGVLERVDDPAAKGRALQALMVKLQPEGGHVPIDDQHPLYRKAVEGILIVRVPLERLDGKSKLGQNRTPAELAGVCARLWARGRPGDARAIERLRAANPDLQNPPFLAAPDGVRLVCAMAPDEAPRAAALLEDAYWTVGIPARAIEAAHRACAAGGAWVGARDERSGALIGSARATSDGERLAWMLDVIVAPSWRGRGVGRALIRLLLDHPSVRSARKVRLGTRDAQRLYEGFGFRVLAEIDDPWPHSEMMLAR